MYIERVKGTDEINKDEKQDQSNIFTLYVISFKILNNDEELLTKLKFLHISK